MKEVKITIIGENNSNTVKEFKGKEAIKEAANVLNDLAGFPRVIFKDVKMAEDGENPGHKDVEKKLKEYVKKLEKENKGLFNKTKELEKKLGIKTPKMQPETDIAVEMPAEGTSKSNKK